MSAMDSSIPLFFRLLAAIGVIEKTDILHTADDFFMVYKSLSDILSRKGILDVPDSSGERLACDRFFDDWFLYAVPNERDFVYSLVKMREQEHDTEEGLPADGDNPGVTVSFIAFDYEIFQDCLKNPTDENRQKLNTEINRVVFYRGQRHHRTLKKYFKNPASQASYLVAELYTRHIAAFAQDGRLPVPEFYKGIVQQSISYKSLKKLARLPRFIEELNRQADRVICDNEFIYFRDPAEITSQEALAILATHTGNTSLYSFAAEVEYHAKFLLPWARIKIPFFGKSIYESAIRADMTVADPEFEGPAPFYQAESKLVKRQIALHGKEFVST